MSVEQGSDPQTVDEGTAEPGVLYIPPDMARPTPEAIEAGHQAQAELAQIQGDPQVGVDTQWWGFRIILNPLWPRTRRCRTVLSGHPRRIPAKWSAQQSR